MPARGAEIPGQTRRAVIRLAAKEIEKELGRNIGSNSIVHGSGCKDSRGRD